MFQQYVPLRVSMVEGVLDQKHVAVHEDGKGRCVHKVFDMYRNN